MIREGLLIFLASALAACVAEGAGDEMFDEDAADTGAEIVFKSDPTLSTTRDYEELDGASLPVAVVEDAGGVQVWTHDIAVFEPARFAYFAIDNPRWRLSVLQGLASEVGGLRLTASELTECRSVASGEFIDCPTGGATGKFTSVLIDAQDAVAHVRAIVGDFDLSADIHLDGRAINNFYHVIPLPVQMAAQDERITLRTCNQPDCW